MTRIVIVRYSTFSGFARLLGEIGAHEHHDGADHARRERQANRVVVGGPAAAAFLVEVVVRPGQAQVVGKEPHQGRELGDRDDAEDARADQDAIGEHREVEGALRRGLVRHGPSGQERHLAATDGAIDQEGEDRRQQENHADDRAHLEVLLADHLLVDVGRQHVVLPADDLRGAEVGDDRGEDDEGRADQAVARSRERATA